MNTIFCSVDDLPELGPHTAAVGFFDGFHQGHVKLLEEAEALASAKGIRSAVLTFDPDPWTVFNPGGNLDHLISLHDKMILADSLGIDEMIVLHFDKSFASLSIEDFHAIIEKLSITDLVCGYDYTYASKGAGNVDTLKAQNGFGVHVVDKITADAKKISSTRIEKLVRSGNVEKAAELLGYYYSAAGIIGYGYRRGRKMQFPTANLEPDQGTVIPQTGVYAGYVCVEGELYQAMINIGSNPTFGNTSRSIEAYLLNFDGDLYGKRVRFFFVEYLRSEIRFEGADALKKQLEKDEKAVAPALEKTPALLEQTLRLWNLKLPSDILK